MLMLQGLHDTAALLETHGFVSLFYHELGV